MEKFNIINENELYKSDFEHEIISKGLTIIEKAEIQETVNEFKELFLKSKVNYLNEEENNKFQLLYNELKRVNQFVVVDDNLNKSVKFTLTNNTNIEKAKYFKREGTSGHYKYYYTEKQYNKEKGINNGKNYSEEEFNKKNENINSGDNNTILDKKELKDLKQKIDERVNRALSEKNNKFKKEDLEDKIAEYAIEQVIKDKKMYSPTRSVPYKIMLKLATPIFKELGIKNILYNK